MQGLADGYFILPYTIGDYLASAKLDEDRRRPPGVPAGRRRRSTVLHPAPARRSRASGRWIRSTASWASSCGTSAAWRGMRPACARPWRGSRSCGRSSGATSTCPGSDAELNQALEKAGRVADFLELGELMCRDALHREESCGGHFREEYQTEDGEALRDDEHFAYVARLGVRRAPTPTRRLHKEPLDVRVRAPGPAELQVRRSILLQVWRQTAPRARRGAWSATRRTTSARHVVPRDARRGQRAADGAGRSRRSPSITTAARGSAARAA